MRPRVQLMVLAEVAICTGTVLPLSFLVAIMTVARCFIGIRREAVVFRGQVQQLLFRPCGQHRPVADAPCCNWEHFEAWWLRAQCWACKVPGIRSGMSGFAKIDGIRDVLNSPSCTSRARTCAGARARTRARMCVCVCGRIVCVFACVRACVCVYMV